MVNQQQAIQQSRLGNILVKRAYINQSQLLKALSYQAKRKIKLGTALIELKLISRKQLNFALRRQSWSRTIAASIALAFAPFSSAFAAEKPKTDNQANAKSIQKAPTSALSLNNPYTSDLYFSTTRLDQQSKEYYFTGKNGGGFTLSKFISDTSGLQLSLFSKQASGYDSQASYEFDPQISLFKSSSISHMPNYSNTKIGNKLDRYSNSKPVVYMLTLKGRCLLENSGKETKMWSLDSAKKGVQRKAQLMFSITKQF